MPREPLLHHCTTERPFSIKYSIEALHGRSWKYPLQWCSGAVPIRQYGPGVTVALETSESPPPRLL